RRGLPWLIAGNALVFLCLAWTVVLAAETYLRYVYDRTDSFGLTLTNWSWFRRHVYENSRGMRDVEWRGGKPPGVELVACVGDSFTMGWGVDDVADCWPQRIGAALEKHAPGLHEVRNYAVPGLTTRQEANLLEAVFPQDHLDRVILGYCLNDT